ncbi:MAG: helix-turn-helix domain-containing protein, partial [Cyanobium sp.]
MLSDPVAPLPSEGVGDETIPELVRLGEQLTRARESAGFSMDALAKRLSVEPRLLQALEQGDHRKLPEGVFIIATARRIAGSLNVNVEDAIASVRQSRLMDHRSASRSPSPGDILPEKPSSQPGRRPPTPWVWPLAALLTACGAAAAWLLLAQTPSRSPSSPPALAPV